MSTSSLKSLGSSSSIVYDRNSPQGSGSDQILPFPCRIMPRSPEDILAKKSEVDMFGKNFTARYQNRPSEVDIEREIEVKLSYLETIRRLKVGKKTQLCDTELLMMNIKDMEEKKEKCCRLVKQGEEEIGMLNVDTEMMRKHFVNLKMTMNFSKQRQIKTEGALRARLSGLQAELSKKVKNDSDSYMSANVDSCVQFTNLFCLSGQLEQLCMGEQGSKWVIERLLHGDHEERTLVRQELNLPKDLVKYLTSQPCKEVIVVLSEVDSLARKELIHQSSLDINTILGIKGGQDFVTRLVKG